MNDVWALDLEAMAWAPRRPQGTPPTPRSAHTATVTPDGRRVLLFGGQNAYGELGDLHVLDVGRELWWRVHASGKYARARMAHAAIRIGWDVLFFGGMPPNEDQHRRPRRRRRRARRLQPRAPRPAHERAARAAPRRRRRPQPHVRARPRHAGQPGAAVELRREDRLVVCGKISYVYLLHHARALRERGDRRRVVVVHAVPPWGSCGGSPIHASPRAISRCFGRPSPPHAHTATPATSRFPAACSHIRRTKSSLSVVAAPALRSPPSRANPNSSITSGFPFLCASLHRGRDVLDGLVPRLLQVGLRRLYQFQFCGQTWIVMKSACWWSASRSLFTYDGHGDGPRCPPSPGARSPRAGARRSPRRSTLGTPAAGSARAARWRAATP